MNSFSNFRFNDSSKKLDKTSKIHDKGPTELKKIDLKKKKKRQDDQ